MTNLEKIQLYQELVDQVQRESLRPVCRLRLSREPFGVTDSHLGGVPYVPREGQIPTDEDGNQLWLCAQINFAQMPRLEGFPQEGILQIFLSDMGLDDFGLCGEDSGEGTPQEDWKTAWYPDVDGTVTMEECAVKMAVPWEEASKENMPRTPHKFDLEEIARGDTDLWRCPNVPLKLTFLPAEEEGAGDEEYLFQELFCAALEKRLPGADPEEFNPYRMRSDVPEEREALDRLEKQTQRGGCKIGGHPRYYQCDPRENPYRGMSEESLKQYSISPEQVRQALAQTAWDTLLFQLDDDDSSLDTLEDMDLYLGGCGSINFLIRSEDLKNRDFSHLLAQWACT